MTRDDLEEYITLIESIDTTTASIQEIRDVLEPIVGLIFLGTPLIDNSHSFYRAVRLESKPKVFENLIYPPKQYLTNYQRLNEPGCPVFYCTTSVQAAVYEGRYKEGDFVTISQWEVIEKKTLVATNVGYTEHLNNWSSQDIPKWHKGVKLKNVSDDDKEKNNIILNFLSALFCKNFDDDKSGYKLCIAISNLLGFNTESQTEFKKTGEQEFEGTTPFDGFIYPSILMNAEVDNLAIRTHSFHKKMKFVSAEYVKIISITKNNFKVEEIDFANNIDEDGNISWKGRRGNWVSPQGVEVVLTKIAKNEFTIARKDGGKLYKN